MIPKLQQFETNCIESANTLLKIQQVAGLYPADYINSMELMKCILKPLSRHPAADTWSCAPDYLQQRGPADFTDPTHGDP